MRQPIIAGNWKMNNTIAATKALLTDLIPLVADAKAEVVVCVPYTNIAAAGELVKGTNIKLGAENVHWAEKGAFTGEISADMLVCVGETLEEREGGIVEEVLVRQTTEAFKDIDKDQLENIVIAYEPVWAIGTGKTATAQDANDTIAIIRNTMAKLYCEKCAEEKVRIQYGGSMNPKNASELMAMPQIDGGLIGGASLKAVDFSQVVKY